MVESLQPREAQGAPCRGGLTTQQESLSMVQQQNLRPPVPEKRPQPPLVCPCCGALLIWKATPLRDGPCPKEERCDDSR